jgi:hypothetical protein
MCVRSIFPSFTGNELRICVGGEGDLELARSLDHPRVMRNDARWAPQNSSLQAVRDGWKSSAVGTLVLALVFPVLALFRPSGRGSAGFLRQAAVALMTCVAVGLILGNVLVALRR